MDFPITRRMLQSIRPIVEEANTVKYVEAVVENIKQRIVDRAYVGGTSLRIDIGSRQSREILDHLSRYGLVYDPNIHAPMILEGLTEVFPDVSFQIDPLKTYILADWS